MKTIAYIKSKTAIASTAVALYGLIWPMWGDEQVKPGQVVKDPLTQTETLRARERLGPITQASKILSATVRNSENKKIGEVKEIAVDIESGRALQAILSVGGFLGIGDKLVAVPPSALMIGSEGDVQVKVDPARFKDAPVFDMSKWDESYQPERLISIYRYYEVRPYFDTTYDRPQQQAAPPAVSTYPPGKPGRFGYVEKASKVIGLPVKNLANETVGKVEDLDLDLAANRIVQVVVAAGGFLGIGDELNAIPPTSFAFNGERNALVLNVNKETLTGAPRFKRGDWATAGQPSTITESYRYYRTEPYYEVEGTDVDNARRNVRDREGATITPFEQGNNKADIETTANIRKEIVVTSNLSLNARNVKIITRDGRVTLRGVVDTEPEKALLGEIAGRYASKNNVDNQLEVKKAGRNF